MRFTIPRIKIPFTVKKRAKTGLSVYITDRTLRILELDDRLQPTFEPVAHVWSGKGINEKIEILKGYVEKYGLRGKEVISALHVTDGLLKYYKYPATLNQKDLISSIDWVIKREQSIVKEETLYDY